MNDIFSRTRLLIGGGVDALSEKTVAVFGLGGVGSFATESLARSGIGNFLLIDNDVINTSNINRQLYALHSTLGKFKTDVAEARVKDINPKADIIKYPVFFDEESCDSFDFSRVDYFIDCIDSLASKILLIKTAKSLNKPIISCLGTGNKLNNTAFKVSDIYQTSVCPLAKILRNALRREEIESLKVVYSEEVPLRKIENKIIPSISFVPPVAGMIMAGQVIKDMLEVNL